MSKNKQKLANTGKNKQNRQKIFNHGRKLMEPSKMTWTFNQLLWFTTCYIHS